MKKIDEVVNAYVACGNAIGYFYAESILMKYLPANKPDGKCFDVPTRNRHAFLVDLKNAAEHSVHLTRGSVAQKVSSKSKGSAKPARG